MRGLKYESTLVTFTEVPDEIALCFNLTRCPCRCPGCFEPWLAEDGGIPLTLDAILELYHKKIHCSCICFMGGDNDHEALIQLCRQLRIVLPHVKIAMYSGLSTFDQNLAEELDYYKVGPYHQEQGPLNSPTTNQVFYKKEDNGNWQDITFRFQVKKE